MRLKALLLLLIAAPPLWAIDSGAIDRYLQQRLDHHRVLGAQVIIVREGSPVYTRAFGEAKRGTPMTVNTPVIIGSLSKAFTATAVLQLVDKQAVKLDQPVRTYLPEFQLGGVSPTDAITVRDLLNQTSGIRSDAPRASNTNPTLEDHVRALANEEVTLRGERHIYSSPNYQILGLLVERLSGRPFGQSITEEIFKPLGMTRSFVDIEPARRSGLAPGHNLWFGLALPSLYAHEPDRLPTASIITTANDLARFVSAHLGYGPAILSSQSLRIAHQGVAPAGNFRYAMGWREGETSGVPSLWHGGALPSYRGAVVMLPQTGTGVIVLTNTSSMFHDHTREIAGGIVSILHDRVPSGDARPLRTTYLWIALAAVVILALQARAIIRSLRLRPERNTLLKVAALDVILPVAVLITLPRMTGISWRGMFEGVPDVVTVLVIILMASIGAGAVRLARGLRRSPLAAQPD